MITAKLYELFLENPKICIDSRKAEVNSIFFALKGDSFNGNAFAAKALEKCTYAIIDESKYAIDDRYIVVDNALEMLQSLATYHRKRIGIPIIAITGTNGKTTTKELIARVMGKKYNVSYTLGNLNNHIGVPITLLQMTKKHEFGVVEMGANHIGEIAFLCKIVAPDFGIITNVGKAHLEGFGSFDGVKKAKGELYRYLYEHNGVAFINDDNEDLEDMNPPHDSLYYGIKAFTHCQGKLLDSSLFLSFSWYATDDSSQEDMEINWDDSRRIINTKLVGKYNFENALAAVCIGNNFGVSPEEIKEAIESYIPDNSRSQVMNTENNLLILDGYNANPSSMKASIENFISLDLPSKVLILGDMLELGTAAIREHGVLVGLIGENYFDKVILIGTNFNAFADGIDINTFMTVKEAEVYLKANQLIGKSILVKGSRGMHLEQLLYLL